jgi:hypothetical protein
MTKEAESPIPAEAGERGISAISGKVAHYGGHGVWVPPGLQPSWILAAAEALEQSDELDTFTARHYARTVLLTVLPTLEAHFSNQKS